MSNKTALQGLTDKIDTLENFANNISPDHPNDERYFAGYKDALNSVKRIIGMSNLQEKEKQQIMEAYKAGVSGVQLAEDYYNEKYEINKV
ncbi:hypothetical protein FCL53_16985 [Elizabethkingia meningoseptica]|uniref:hypothetical protein n=1 Tax=Elizabethkingia meningoseptica TaxID=238 RepID=UPI0013652BDE|nr:hypothetical protein [Elizabethkingia meningoseptica]MVW93659.1 hypothetical protein [Elizabethkingia meningoseptica]